MDRKELKRKGFRYIGDDFYSLRFPVLFYRGKGIVDTELVVNAEDKSQSIMVYQGDSVYPAWYNREYGNNRLVNIIQRNIDKELKRLHL